MTMIELTEKTVLLSNDSAQVLLLEATTASLPYLYPVLQAEYQADSVIRMIRGSKCKTSAALFDEWAAVWQFPIYFGENWSAWCDCLRDLPAINRLPHCVVVAHAAQLLKGSPEELAIFYQIIEQLPEDWQQRYELSNALPLKLILHEEQAQIQGLQARLQTLHIPYQSVKSASTWEIPYL